MTKQRNVCHSLCQCFLLCEQCSLALAEPVAHHKEPGLRFHGEQVRVSPLRPMFRLSEMIDDALLLSSDNAVDVLLQKIPILDHLMTVLSQLTQVILG